MKAAVALLEVFLVAVVLALLVTVYSVPFVVKFLALALVAPFVAVGFLLVRHCRRGEVWAFAGGAVLGALGVFLRLFINAHPNLEVGGGLPLWVTLAYVVLGGSVSVACGLVAFAGRTDRKTPGVRE